MRKRLALASLVIVAAAIAACSKSTGPTQVVGGHSYTIVASGSMSSGGGYGGGYSSTSGGQFFFSPVPDSVRVDSVVTFRFNDVQHTVTFDGMPMTAAIQNIPGTSNTDATRTFVVAGTYTWHCSIHPYMHGTLVVQ